MPTINQLVRKGRSPVRWKSKVETEGAGKPIDLDGGQALHVMLIPAEAHTEAGKPTWTGTSAEPLTAVTGIVSTGDFEELLAQNAKLYPLISLALFDDESRTNDVMPRLKKIGQWAIDAFTVCKMGPHERHEGELRSLIDNSKRLAQTIQGLA